MTAGIEFDPAEREAIAAEMNLSVLQRSDPAIKSVLMSATHVALYQLLDDNHQWTRLDIEGSLFIVERDLNHQNNPTRNMHRVVIINRKSLDNYNDDIIVGNKQLELNNQMIMYSNSKRATIGIWFYRQEEAKLIFDLLQKIVNGEQLPPSAEPARPKRTPKRGQKATTKTPNKSRPPPAQPPRENVNVDQIPTDASPPDNSLQRFFPNLKLKDGVAGQAVPDAVQESLFESEAVTALSRAPDSSKTATAFKPTAEIDGAIIQASETGLPEDIISGCAATDVDALSSLGLKNPRSRPKSDTKRRSAARPRQNPKASPPPRPSPAPKASPPQKTGPATKSGTPARPSPPARQNSQPKSSPPPKRNTSTKRGPPPKVSPVVNVTASPASSKPTSGGQGALGGRTGADVKVTPGAKAEASVEVSAPSSVKAAEGATPVSPNRLAAHERETSAGSQAVVSQGEGTCVVSSGGAQARGKRATSPVSKADGASPTRPNVPTAKEMQGSPRARGAKAEQAVNGDSSGHGLTEGPRMSAGMVSTSGALGHGSRAVEEAQRRLQSMSMRQAHAENLKLQEAHLRAMQPYRFGTGAEVGVGQAGSMMGAGLGAGGAGGAGYAPSLHPQMALMMQQQQQHHMFMQQQYMAQQAQQHQRHMQMQGIPAGPSGVAGLQAGSVGMGDGIGTEGGAGGAHGKNSPQESADQLMRMLKVDRGDASGRKGGQKSRPENKQVGRSVGSSIATAGKNGELGTSGGSKLDKSGFRAVLQRMLTDRKLFDCVYEHYLSAPEES